MAEYIELGKAKRFFNNIDSGRRGCSTLLTPTEFAEYLDEIETADVSTVQHGKWECEHDSYGKLQCSNCKKEALLEKSAVDIGTILLYVTSNYCPHCGARMNDA